MSTYYDKCFDRVVGHEGGFTSDRRDRGNWTSGVIGKGELKGTRWGISAMAYPHLDIRNLTLADAKAIYLRDYWRKASCDLLPQGVAFIVFDISVNSGVKQAIKFLQASVGATADGIVGSKTIQAVNRSKPETIIREICNRRLQFYKSLSTYKIYGRGWTNRLISTRKQALSDLK